MNNTIKLTDSESTLILDEWVFTLMDVRLLYCL